MQGKWELRYGVKLSSLILEYTYTNDHVLNTTTYGMLARSLSNSAYN